MSEYTWEGYRIVAPISFNSNQPQFISDTANLKRLVSSQDAQRWELSFGVEPTANSGNLLHAMTSLATDSTTMIMPQVMKEGDVTEAEGAATSYAAYSAGANDIVLELPVGDLGKWIRRGTFIKFASHDKVYMVTASAQVYDNAGDAVANVSIYPDLRATTVLNEAVSYKDDVTFSYWIGNEVNGITFSDGKLAQVNQIQAIEAL